MLQCAIAVLLFCYSVYLLISYCAYFTQAVMGIYMQEQAVGTHGTIPSTISVILWRTWLVPHPGKGPLCLRHTNLALEHLFQKCSCALRSGLSKAHCSQPCHLCHITLSDKPYVQRPRGGTLLCLASFTQSYVEVGWKGKESLENTRRETGIRSLNLVEACHQQGNNPSIITNCLRPLSLPDCKPTIF